MKKGNKSLGSRLRALLLVFAMLVSVTIPSFTAFADTEYMEKWSEYKDSGNLPDPDNVTWNDVADAMDMVFDAAVELHEAGEYRPAFKALNDAYYGYYEVTGFERIVMGYISGSRVKEVELQFAAAKSVTKGEGSLEDFQAEVDILKEMIRADAHTLDGTTPDDSTSSETSGEAGSIAEALTAANVSNAEAIESAIRSEINTTVRSAVNTTTNDSGNAAGIAAFAASFSIMLREGFEAILIVGAIIAYLSKSETDEKERKRKIRPVYIGSVLGIVLSFVLAWLLNAIKLANTASQEIIEGVTALIAVCVLYYVAMWMLSKSESDAWNQYIKDKVKSGSERGSLFALAFTAFLAVFREGAEVVLFFQPMLAGDNTDMVWMGFVIGCVVLVLVYLLIRFLSVTIPLKPFFVGTSVIMCLMSISFLGNGIVELIEGDVIAMTSPSWLQWIPTNDVLSVLGIYPVLETLIPQLILLLVSIFLFARTIRQNQKIHREAEARRAEERREKEEKERLEAEEKLVATIRENVIAELREQGLLANS